MRVIGPTSSPALVVLAPGDMGRCEDPAASVIASTLAAAGLQVVQFDAPPHAGEEALDDARFAVKIQQATRQAAEGQLLVLGGLSRGARVAASLAAELDAAALLAFAFPFHPRRDPDPGPRLATLGRLQIPVWIFQGSRDSHGNREQVTGYALGANIAVHWLEDANHLLIPRQRSGREQGEQLAASAELAASLILELAAP